jgi:hypothetical protein
MFRSHLRSLYQNETQIHLLRVPFRLVHSSFFSPPLLEPLLINYGIMSTAIAFDNFLFKLTYN